MDFIFKSLQYKGNHTIILLIIFRFYFLISIWVGTIVHQRCVAVCDVIFYFHTFNRDVSRKFSSRKHFHTFTSSELSISQLTCSGFTVSLALQTPASGSAANGVILTIALAKEKKRKARELFFPPHAPGSREAAKWRRPSGGLTLVVCAGLSSE